MAKRLLGALLCALLIGASTFDAFADVTQKNFSFTLQLETSYFSVDSLDDFNDTSLPGRTIKWSAREKVGGNFVLGAKVRRVKFSPPPLFFFELTAHSRLTSQDFFRFQEVCRI